MKKVIIALIIGIAALSMLGAVYAQQKVDLKTLKDNVSKSIIQFKSGDSKFYNNDNFSDNFTFARDNKSFNRAPEIRTIAVDADVKSMSFKRNYDVKIDDAARDILVQRVNKTDNRTFLDNLSREVMQLNDNDNITGYKLSAKDNLSKWNPKDNLTRMKNRMDNYTAFMAGIPADNGTDNMTSLPGGIGNIDIADKLAGELYDACITSGAAEEECLSSLADNFTDYGEDADINENFYEISVLGGDEKKCREQHDFQGLSKTNICGWSAGCWDDGTYYETDFCKGDMKVTERYICKESDKGYTDYDSCAASCGSICATATNYDDPKLKWHGMSIDKFNKYNKEEKEILAGKDLGLCQEVRTKDDFGCLWGYYDPYYNNPIDWGIEKKCLAKKAIRTNHYYCCYSDQMMMNLSYSVKKQLGIKTDTCEGIPLKDFLKADLDDPKIKEYLKSKGFITDDMLADFKGKFNKAGDAADDNKTVAQKREDFSDNYTKVLEEAKEKFNFSVPRI